MIDENRIAQLEEALRETQIDIEYLTLTQIAFFRFMERRFPGSGELIFEVCDRMKEEAQHAGKLDKARMLDALVDKLDHEFRAPAND